MDSPVGTLTIAGSEHGITLITTDDGSEMLQQVGKQLKLETVECDTPLLRHCREQLQQYFAGERKAFDLPIHVKGTDFTTRVWDAMAKVEYGTTATYSALAQAAGSPKGYRAAAQACHTNRLMIVLPCHRIVASKGLGGYRGGIQIKEKLLELEKKLL
ncbi:MAG: methylated-DNA--[protein]-cysteine S-methyltransferase [Muribaculaceae bacterium]|nr:methylated-DNA--[protein]-cysteine S-methyltransferase [Muribaculaceae bacterium]